MDQNTNEILFKKLENELRRMLKDEVLIDLKRGLTRSTIGRVVLSVTASYYQAEI